MSETFGDFETSTPKEVETLVKTVTEFEKEKDEKNKSLKDYFSF